MRMSRAADCANAPYRVAAEDFLPAGVTFDIHETLYSGFPVAAVPGHDNSDPCGMTGTTVK